MNLLLKEKLYYPGLLSRGIRKMRQRSDFMFLKEASTEATTSRRRRRRRRRRKRKGLA